MAEYYGHFDLSGATPTYAAATYAQFVQILRLSGVAYNFLNALEVAPTGAGLSVTIDTGAGLAGGYYYITTAAITENIDAQGAGTDRIDRIVMRATAASSIVETAVLKGTAAVSPTAPALTQTAAVWEESLAQVYVAGGAVNLDAGDITDERSYIERADGIPIADAGGLITAVTVEAALQELATNIAVKYNTADLTSANLQTILTGVYALVAHTHATLAALAIVNDVSPGSAAVVNVYLLASGGAEPAAATVPRGTLLATYTP